MNIIDPGAGAVVTVNFEEPVTLETLQAAVKGYIELVPYWNSVFDDKAGRRVKCRVFCNEHGKIEDLPYNPRATLLWAEAIKFDYGSAHTMNDHLRGPVAIVTGDDEFMAEL